ncbi:MAG: DNA polymerase III subunit gamma/tau [Steroidobacteraceae bacterium]
MSYTALARKWRPRTFAEMAGQEHVLRALSNALASGKVHHAFLFTGTRGVGKTTVARVLAKCLNCERGLSATPCGECASCREIDAGRSVDLIEVDAASRTKVEDTRDLLDNVQYLPTSSRFKIYLIDEVHMLTAHSFNALLKTLEEPPPHAKFLLATTDPQKLPVTVLSRCLQFNLKRLPVATIVARLKQILEAEGIAFEAPALRLLAVAADGSLRDGLSLLDQLIAFGGGKVDEADTRAMLGTIDRQHVAKLAQLLATGDASALITHARSLEQWSPDHAQILDELATLLVQVALRQSLSAPLADDDGLFAADLIEALAEALAPEDVQLYYQIALVGRRDLGLAPDPRSGFEMTLVRMLAFRPAGVPGGAPAPERAPRATPALASAQAGQITRESWSAVVAVLELGGPARQLANNCLYLAREGDLVQLTLDPRSQVLRTSAQEDKLAQALSRFLGTTVRVQIEVASATPDTPARADEWRIEAELAAARSALENDPAGIALKERFGASLQPESVRPARRT